MNRSLQIKGAICVAVLLLSVYLLLPTFKAIGYGADQREAANTDPALKSEIDAADSKAIRRGLDLLGGMYLVLEVDTADMGPEQAADARARVREIISNRVDQFGVSEPTIQLVGESRIIVQLPGLQDPERAKNLIGRTARLEFRIVHEPEASVAAIEKLDAAFRAAGVPDPEDEAAADDEATDDPAADPAAEDAEVAVADGDTVADPYAELPDQDDAPATDGEAAREELRQQYPFRSLLIQTPFPYFYVLEEDVAAVEQMLAAPESKVIGRDIEFQLGMDLEPYGDGRMGRYLYPLETKVALAGDRLTGSRERPDQNKPGNWNIGFDLDRKGARQFAKVTGENVERFLAISLDGRVKSAPRINGRIPNGSGVIEGPHTISQASDLSLLLRAGALPADVSIAEERTVGPSLGSDSINQGVKAAMWGSILVAIFMLIYYRGTGLIVVAALVSNILILMAVLAQFGLVLTLPGIAGIILTVGMAVDANVLINERIREELRKAKTLRAAIQSGYANATRTIIDANVTTLIVGLVLWNFGSGPVQGFAVTLCIGIVTSVFTALVLTRVIAELVHKNAGKQKVQI